jgi:hypothetical protein
MEFLDDVPLGQLGYLHLSRPCVLGVLGQSYPADTNGGEYGEYDERPGHDNKSLHL